MRRPDAGEQIGDLATEQLALEARQRIPRFGGRNLGGIVIE